MNGKQLFVKGAGVCFDAVMHPEGPGNFAKEAKDATSLLTALFAFVATGSGALALAEKINISKPFSLILYLALSLTAMSLVVRLLRLKRAGSRAHYYDRGSILYGKFVLYVSLVATIFFAWAYWNGLFSPSKPPFTLQTITLSTPVVLREHAVDHRSLVQDIVDQKDSRTLMGFVDILEAGLQKGHIGGNVYATWSTQRLEKDYDDFQCEVFPELNTSSCLVFLYSAYATKFSTQSSLRQLYFDVLPPPKESLARTFQVRSPWTGDRILLLFWSESKPSHPLVLTNKTIKGPR